MLATQIYNFGLITQQTFVVNNNNYCGIIFVASWQLHLRSLLNPFTPRSDQYFIILNSPYNFSTLTS